MTSLYARQSDGAVFGIGDDAPYPEVHTQMFSFALTSAGVTISSAIPVAIDSDRACYISGETWMGNAKNCRHAIYLAVGTGIGAGIMIDGTVLRGSHDIAGAIGWMALHPHAGASVDLPPWGRNSPTDA